MAVTNYYTVNGMIMGESTGGVTTTYGRDALGSVAATFDSAGALQNTYRYSPYGTNTTKTGEAADPKFLWNAASGYRGTGAQYSSHYVRARHYVKAAGRWATVDALWPATGAYLYAKLSPVQVIDRTGLRPCRWVVGSLPSASKEYPQGVSCLVVRADHNGAETGCNFDVGTPWTCGCDSACDSPCTDAHEGQHRADMNECCKRAHLCIKRYSRATCVDAFFAWSGLIEAWTESRAYKAGAYCREQYIGRNSCYGTGTKSACCKDYIGGWMRDQCYLYGVYDSSCNAPGVYQPPKPFTPCPFDFDGTPPGAIRSLGGT